MTSGHRTGSLSRRRILAATVTAAGALAAEALPTSVFGQNQKERFPQRTLRFAYTGCRTTKERNARGEGINVFRVDATTGEWAHVQLTKDLVNPSFLAFDRNQRFLYAVHGDAGEVSAFRVHPDNGQIAFINKQSTGGHNPVHLVADVSNKYLLVANYATGSLAVLPFRVDGGLEAVLHRFDLPGEGGPHAKEQSGSHPHEIVYDPTERFLIVPDKGVDRIFSFAFDAAQGTLIPANPPFVTTRPGAGPRHVVFHATMPFAYLTYELDSSVAAYRYDGARGALQPLQIIPSIPDTYTSANTSAEIDMIPGGRFIYASNRGHDSIGAFAVDSASGRLSPVRWTPSQGKGPRFMAIEPGGRFLYAANENSDTIVAFRIDRDKGELELAGPPIQTGSPTCIVFSTTS